MPNENAPAFVREPDQHVIPTVGRVVLYRAPDQNPHKGYQCYPAMVTHVWGPYTVNLHVQNDGSFPLPTESLMPTSVEYAEKPGETPRTWSWPPRAGS